MVIHLTPQLEAALNEQSRRLGVDPEELVLKLLNERLHPIEPQDEWERELLDIGVDCGVSLPDAVLTTDGLYD